MLDAYLDRLRPLPTSDFRLPTAMPVKSPAEPAAADSEEPTAALTGKALATGGMVLHSQANPGWINPIPTCSAFSGRSHFWN